MMLRMLKIDKFHLIVMLFPVFFYCFFTGEINLIGLCCQIQKKLEKKVVFVTC